ncbi:MAG TPA: 2,3-bisphosphoglycerate-independent phosphoglycerate mutase [Desulfonatronum sp.]|nr:2,3-bisphosphoglycerate-independent phosphoglycerate mutase [Desulfonatronum sp.]
MPSKCLLMVLDGLGDRSHECLDHQTPLQAAQTPGLDRIAALGANGLYHAGMLGEALPSETAHLAMFGYDRIDFPGRGALEALGAGVVLTPGEVAVLAHFTALEEKDGCLRLVRDVPLATDEEIQMLITAVGKWEHAGVRIRFVPIKGVFGVLVLSGPVCPHVTDTGPMRDGSLLPELLPLAEHATDPAAQTTALSLKAYLSWAFQRLTDHPVNASRTARGLAAVNGLVTQRAGRLKTVMPFTERFGLHGASIASGAVFRGLGRYLGLDVFNPLQTGDLEQDFSASLAMALDALTTHDFVHLHTKAPDEAAHAKDPLLKKQVIETLDRALMPTLDGLLADPELLLVVTADHSTPSSGPLVHSGEPVPLVFHGTGVRRDKVAAFNEIDAAGGCLGCVRGTELMRLILNHLDKARLEGIRDTPEDCLYWPGEYRPFII